jgi:hypothetical protein
LEIDLEDLRFITTNRLSVHRGNGTSVRCWGGVDRKYNQINQEYTFLTRSSHLKPSIEDNNSFKELFEFK